MLRLQKARHQQFGHLHGTPYIKTDGTQTKTRSASRWTIKMGNRAIDKVTNETRKKVWITLKPDIEDETTFRVVCPIVMKFGNFEVLMGQEAIFIPGV